MEDEDVEPVGDVDGPSALRTDPLDAVRGLRIRTREGLRFKQEEGLRSNTSCLTDEYAFASKRCFGKPGRYESAGRRSPDMKQWGDGEKRVLPQTPLDGGKENENQRKSHHADQSGGVTGRACSRLQVYRLPAHLEHSVKSLIPDVAEAVECKLAAALQRVVTAV